jgi:exopolyphosphatase/guanosine-5'-triphosphate,3'-diphosphate pyrophosphatase
LAVAKLLRDNGWSAVGITRKGLKYLRKALCEAGRVDKIVLPGLDPDRAPVLPGGLAILSAVFKSLRIESMSPSTGALREGLLYDLLGRIRHEDVRDRTIRWLADHHGVDLEQAVRIERAALLALDQVEQAWCLRHDEARHYLSWASRLHEIGLEISHAGYHKHSAYIVENSDMPGFSKTEQQLLGVVIRGHRRKLLREHFAKLPPGRIDTAVRLSVLFRLACCLNRSRSNRPPPEVTLSAKKSTLSLAFPKNWLEENPLTLADLQEDAARLGEMGFQLRLE